MTNKNTVKIHNKEYEVVASRVQRFREEHQNYSITTEIFSNSTDQIMFKASILDETGRILATGHAEETRGSTQINRTSALENCETSAIGRALACYGYIGTEFASADEVATAISQQASDPGFTQAYLEKPLSGGATDKQINMIQLKRNQLKAKDPAGYELFKAYYEETFAGQKLKDLTKQQASDLIEKLGE
jgi:hypothetical protein